MKSANFPSFVPAASAAVAPSPRAPAPPARATLVLGVIWLALGARMALAWIGPKLDGDLTLPGLAFFVITAVLASRLYAFVAKPAPTPAFDDEARR